MTTAASFDTQCRMGVGLRPTHYPFLEEASPNTINWFEAISENYIGTKGRPIEILEKIRKDFPIALHGVSLNIANPKGVDTAYLKELKKLIDLISPFIVSDHLCWTSTNAHGNLHDLLPLPFTKELIEIISSNIDKVQNILNREILLENASTYLTFKTSEMTEWDFINEILKKSGSFLLLDVNNTFVNSKNHTFDPMTYIKKIDKSKIKQIHLAGHTDMGEYLFDTHSDHVADPVWDLYRELQKDITPETPVLIEWDEDIPDFNTLEKESLKAKKIWKEVHDEIKLD